MRRWNGWGDETIRVEPPANAERFLIERVGAATPLPEISLARVLETVPPSRLPEHPLIVREPEDRVRHARGQSLPDWLAMRGGDFDRFPDGVAYPEHGDQVRELLDFCAARDIAVIPYGGGTSVAGHINPPALDRPVLTLDMGRMNRLLDLDEDSQIATFGAGTPGPLVEAQLRVRGFTLGHFPQSFELSTLGGWVASRSSGQQSLRYGRIEQLFAGGRLETPTGRLDIPTLPASSAGPDIREMVLGSEGRMGVLTEVKVRVTPLAERERFHVLFFPSWERAAACARRLVQERVQLSMVRVSNAVETETQLALAGHEGLIRLLERFLAFRGVADGKCMMTVGVTGSAVQCRAALGQVKRLGRAHGGVHVGSRMGAQWAKNRFRLPYLREALWRRGYAVDTLETATDWSNVDALLGAIEDNLRHALDDSGERVHVFTHLSHLYGQGASIYTTYVFRAADGYAETLERWRRLKHTTSELIVRNGGTISHQHGVGRDHAPYLAVEKGPLGMEAIEALCRTFDPRRLMNPDCLLGAE